MDSTVPSERRPRVLYVAHDVVGRQMAGPGIRAVELSRALSAACDVTLACPGSPVDLPSTDLPSVRLIGFDPANVADLAAAADESDVVVLSGHVLKAYPFLGGSGRPIVVDLYDPFILESLELHSGRPLADQLAVHDDGLRLLRGLLLAGDYFLCASDRQRDFWMGTLAGLGRVSPELYARDRSVDSLVGIVPFGLPARPPQRRAGVLRGVVPGIGHADRVLLWAGGLWEWFDPLTLIRAVGEVSRARPDVRLFFMSKTHPNAQTAGQMTMPRQAEALARELGLLNEHVFFSDDWIPYAARESYLLEADVGVSTHRSHLETRYSFRTRILDYIWAGLPIVCTSGDSLSEVVAARGLGKVVPPGDVGALAGAIAALLAESDAREARRQVFATVAREYEWSRVAGPLVAFCLQPRKLTDSPGPADESLGELRRRLAAQERELAECRQTIEAIRRGRFMRTMEWLHALRTRISRQESRSG